MKDTNPIFKLWHFFSRFSTRAITSYLFLVSLVCIGLLGAPHRQISLPTKDILSFFAFFILGVSGVVMIFRKEADFGFLSFYGPLAIIVGAFLAILGFFLASMPIIANIH